ncbi:MAG: hypothetical protein L6R39_004195 [Caloplaca ligustica]|nr:MAG: hypothetical protein L6R39_004195 [Caloplaca ligustica]
MSGDHAEKLGDIMYTDECTSWTLVSTVVLTDGSSFCQLCRSFRTSRNADAEPLASSGRYT